MMNAKECRAKAAEALARAATATDPDIRAIYVATVVDCYLALTAGQGVTDSRQCRPRGAGR